MFAIKVGDLWFGMPTDGKVVFELNHSAFEEDVIPGSLTFPNNFPSTPTNDLIFKHARLIDTYSRVKSVDGQLYLLGEYFDRCKIVRLENTKNIYRCSVILNGINIDIQGKTLRDIDFSRHNKTFNLISDALDWMALCNDPNEIEQAVVWPLIKNEIVFDDIKDVSFINDYYDGILNRWNNPTSFAPFYSNSLLSDCKRYFTSPKIRIVSVLEALFNQFGYNVTGSFINDKEQRNLSFFSNKLFQLDSGKLMQASCSTYDAAYEGNPFFPWHFPKITSFNDPAGHDPMDQDYESTIGVFIDNTMDVQYPHDLLKVKVVDGTNYRVVIHAKMSQETTGVVAIGFFGVGLTLNGTGGAINGDVAYQITTGLTVTDETNTYTVSFDINIDEPAFTPNHFSSIALIPIIATGSAISIDSLTFQVVNLDYSGNDIIEPFKLAEFMPNISIEDFLKGVKQAFNLAFNFDWTTNSVSIDKCITSLESPIESIDDRIGDELPTRTADIKGYDFSWDFSKAEDKLIDNNFKAIKTEDFIGYYDTVYPDGADGKIFISRVNNKAFLISVAQDGSRTYTIYTDAFFNTTSGDASKKIVPPSFSPVLMSVAGGIHASLAPNIQTSMHFPRYDLNYNDFSAIRLSYYRGLVAKPFSASLVPVASSMNISNVAGEDPLGKYVLSWDQKLPNSIYNLWWKKWESFIRNTEKIRDIIYIDLPFIQNVFRKQKKLSNSVFVAGKLTFTISEAGIEEGEIELYRNNFQFDPEDGQ